MNAVRLDELYLGILDGERGRDAAGIPPRIGGHPVGKFDWPMVTLLLGVGVLAIAAWIVWNNTKQARFYDRELALAGREAAVLERERAVDEQAALLADQAALLEKSCKERANRQLERAQKAIAAAEFMDSATILRNYLDRRKAGMTAEEAMDVFADEYDQALEQAFAKVTLAGGANVNASGRD
jgi:hypothetical protein